MCWLRVEECQASRGARCTLIHFQCLFYFVRAVLDLKFSLETITETKDCLLSFALVLNFDDKIEKTTT